jgi:hypothetical protein
MLTMEELKGKIEITGTTVGCPVKGCSEKVERQRGAFKREERFKCPRHNIYISPSTFEYQSELDNLLWKDNTDLDLLKKIKTVKRENRIARDNSEDAVTWNVFRFLERNNLVDGFLSSCVGKDLKSAEVIYWSYSQKEHNTWSLLKKTRKEFGEEKQRGSEPDIIIKTDKALFFIEVKLTSPNKIDFDMSHKAKDKEERIKRYSRGERFLKHQFGDIIDPGYYELGRFWVIGCSMAEKLKKDFYLVNLVLARKEKDIERDLGKYIDSNQRRKFIRLTWEDVYQFISKGSLTKDKEIMLEYFRNKTIGYDGNGRLQRAFSIPLTEDKREVKDLPKLPSEQLLLSTNR